MSTVIKRIYDDDNDDEQQRAERRLLQRATLSIVIMRI